MNNREGHREQAVSKLCQYFKHIKEHYYDTNLNNTWKHKKNTLRLLLYNFNAFINWILLTLVRQINIKATTRNCNWLKQSEFNTWHEHGLHKRTRSSARGWTIYIMHDNLCILFICLSFNIGDMSTFVHRGLQNRQNTEVPCRSFERWHMHKVQC